MTYLIAEAGKCLFPSLSRHPNTSTIVFRNNGNLHQVFSLLPIFKSAHLSREVTLIVFNQLGEKGRSPFNLLWGRSSVPPVGHLL